MSDCITIDSCYLLHLLKDLLFDELGTYTYTNNFQTKAIAIGRTPEDIKCQGLEVIIPKLPDLISSERTSSNIVEKLKWKIFIYDRNDTIVDINKLLNKLKNISSLYNYIYIPSSNTNKYSTLVFNIIHYQTHI